MGWASGLQAGIRLGETIRQSQLENALAEEAKKYRVTEGSPEQDTFNSAIDAAIRQKTGLSAGGEAPAPVDTEAGLQSAARAARDVTPQYSFGGQYYANPREAEVAASQARTQGLADVYRSRGYIDKASELESRAQQQQLTGLQIQGAQRTEREQAMDEARKGEDKKWWESRLTDADGKKRAPTSEDMLAAAQRGVASHYQTGNFDKGVASYNQYMDLAEKQILGQERERNRAREVAFTAAADGSEAGLKVAMDFYNKYVPNGSIATGAKLDPKTGVVTVTHTDMDGKKLPDTQIGHKELLQGISSMGDSKQALAYVQQSFMNNLHTQELGIKRQTAATSNRYYNERITDITNAREGRDKAAEIATQFDALTDAEKTGPKGRALITQFNMANAKAGGQVSIGGLSSKGEGKMLKVEDEGEKKTIDGKLVISDGLGNWIPADGKGRPVGVLPSERTKFLKEAGVPDNLVGQLPWSKDGTALLFNGKAYDVKDPKDLKTMVETYKRLGKAEIAMQEGLASDLALQARARQRAGAQPNIYADPLDWQLYRNQERNLGLIPNLNQFPSSQDYP